MADRAVIDYHTSTPAIPPMTAQRDPHLPPPEVCDWLLAQEWSEVVPTAVTSFPAGGPSGITKHEAYDHVYARAALGANEVAAIEMPVEALQLLEEDAWIRMGLRRAMKAVETALSSSSLLGIIPKSEHGQQPAQPESADPETTLLQRVLADAEQAEISAFSAIGVLTTAATMMVSQCYDLTKLGDDHA